MRQIFGFFDDFWPDFHIFRPKMMLNFMIFGHFWQFSTVLEKFCFFNGHLRPRPEAPIDVSTDKVDLKVSPVRALLCPFQILRLSGDFTVKIMVNFGPFWPYF